MIIESLQNEKIKNLNRLITDNRFRKKSGVLWWKETRKQRALQFGFENIEFYICENILASIILKEKSISFLLKFMKN